MTASIRNKIVRFPRKAQYLTGWNGYQTFQQIADHLSPRIAWKLKQFGVYGQDIPDSVQKSLMGLWEQLSADPNLLADTSTMGGMWIALCINRVLPHLRLIDLGLSTEKLNYALTKSESKQVEERENGGNLASETL